MGIINDVPVGRRLKWYVNEHAFSSSHAPTKPAGTDAFRVVSGSITPAQAREDRKSSGMSRSITERITGAKEYTWSIECELYPSGTNTTPPDIGPIIQAAMMGNETVGGSDVTYDLGDTANWFSMWRHDEDVYQDAAINCWVESMGLTFSQGGIAMVTFEGGATAWARAGTGTVNGSGTSTSFSVQSGEGNYFEPGAIISVDSDTDLLITGVSTDTITVDSSITFADNDVVAPNAPTPTYTGSPISGILGSFTLDAVTFSITEFKLDLKNNIQPKLKFGDANPYDISIGNFREVTGSINVRAESEWVNKLGDTKDFSTVALIATAGNASGNRFEASVPTAELEFTGVEISLEEEGTATIPFKALSSGSDAEFTLKHY